MQIIRIMRALISAGAIKQIRWKNIDFSTRLNITPVRLLRGNREIRAGRPMLFGGFKRDRYEARYEFLSMATYPSRREY